MLGRKLLVALAERQRLGRLNETAGAVGKFLEVHVISLGLPQRPMRRAGASSMGYIPPPLT